MDAAISRLYRYGAWFESQMEEVVDPALDSMSSALFGGTGSGNPASVFSGSSLGTRRDGPSSFIIVLEGSADPAELDRFEATDTTEEKMRKLWECTELARKVVVAAKHAGPPKELSKEEREGWHKYLESIVKDTDADFARRSKPKAAPQQGKKRKED